MIPIPERLALKLKTDRGLSGAVDLSLNEFSVWLGANQLYFFPEYTDHSERHIAEVIETASGLISSDAAFTAADAGVLLIACLLHDCAMHLTKDGFRTLVRSGSGYLPLEGFPDQPWDQLWLDYLAEARRFDETKLRQIFGDTEPVREPPLDGALDDRDRYLIGEFLRRHHPRLAHEIAHYGVPGPGEDRIRLVGLDAELADLSGLVARSHGMTVRGCLPYLAEKYHKREYAGVHAAYLMTLLRVADYLQIRAERAPHRLLAVRRLHSPVSKVEWQVHHSIRNITSADDDPEAIFIQAQPADLRTYLRVRQWLDGVQFELDASWAVLGELYGRTPELSGLGMRLRRVRSNLDDRAAFARKATYLPEPAAFTTADARLLPLLVGPLYDDNPAYGVRELLQNALDAVRELEYLLQKQPALRETPRIEQEADVVIRLDDEYLTVSDRGIGMSGAVLRDYVLRAGATFRDSDAWKQRFEDREGRSQVLRSGRFGVGALAAFLLGDRIEVTTRHAEAAEGLTFAASLKDQVIEMRRLACPVGTSIRVHLNPGVAESLLRVPAPWDRESVTWDWYQLRKPSVARFHRDTRLPQKGNLAAAGEPLPPGWHRVVVPGYSDVQWTYDTAPGLVCNGILVTENPVVDLHSTSVSDFETEYWDHRSVQVPEPNLSIFDPSGRLPLNLRRTRMLGRRTPFHDILHEGCIRRLLAATLAAGSTCGFTEGADLIAPHPYTIRNWFSTDQGIGLSDPPLMYQSGAAAFLMIPGEGHIDLKGVRLAPARLPSLHYVSLVSPTVSIGGYLLPAFPATRVFVAPNSPISALEEHGFEVESEGAGGTLYRQGPCPAPATNFSAAAAQLQQSATFQWIGFLVEYYPAQKPPEPTRLSRAWNEIIRVPVIPFSMADRRAQLPHAFEALRDYLNDPFPVYRLEDLEEAKD
jgi:hypothetical protein